MKRLRFKNGNMDDIDAEIVRVLSADARITMTELARRVGLSAPSVIERVRRLEEAGIVTGYAAQVGPSALGLPIAAYLRIRPIPGQLKKITEVLEALAAIVECDRVTGDDCFIAKAHVKSMQELERVIDAIIPFATTNTSIIQSSPVMRRLPPLPSSPA